MVVVEVLVVVVVRGSVDLMFGLWYCSGRDVGFMSVFISHGLA